MKYFFNTLEDTRQPDERPSQIAEQVEEEVKKMSYAEVLQELESLGKSWDKTPTDEEARQALIEKKAYDYENDEPDPDTMIGGHDDY